MNRLQELRQKLREDERLRIVIHSESLVFLLTLNNSTLAREQGGDTDEADPVMALFRIVDEAVLLIARKIKAVMPTAKNGKKKPVGRPTKADDHDELTNLVIASLGGEVGQVAQVVIALLPMFNRDRFRDILRILHWGLLEEDPEIKLGDLEAVVSLQALPTIIGSLWPKMVAYAKDSTPEESQAAKEAAAEEDQDETVKN